MMIEKLKEDITQGCLQEYAKACEETGYDGIAAEDIEEKMQEFLK